MPHPTPLPGETLAASTLQAYGTHGIWTPALTASTTNPTLGTGATQQGSYVINAGLVTIQFTIIFGTSGVAAGSGTYQISSLPFNIDTDWQGAGMALGQVWITDSSATAFEARTLRTTSSPANVLLMSSPTGGSVTNASPWIWAASDSIRGTATYKAAE